MRRPAQPIWYSLIVLLVTVALLGTGAWYVADRADQRSARTARESERAWCSVIVTLDDAYQVAPPQTEIGRKLAHDIAELRRRFGCPTTGG